MCTHSSRIYRSITLQQAHVTTCAMHAVCSMPCTDGPSCMVHGVHNRVHACPATTAAHSTQHVLQAAFYTPMHTNAPCTTLPSTTMSSKHGKLCAAAAAAAAATQVRCVLDGLQFAGGGVGGELAFVEGLQEARYLQSLPCSHPEVLAAGPGAQPQPGAIPCHCLLAVRGGCAWEGTVHGRGLRMGGDRMGGDCTWEGTAHGDCAWRLCMGGDRIGGDCAWEGTACGLCMGSMGAPRGAAWCIWVMDGARK